MTVKEFLAKIDPVEENWKTLSPGHWQNTVTGAKYDTTDIIQAQLDAYNAKRGVTSDFWGFSGVPDEIKRGYVPPTDVSPVRPLPDISHNSRDDLPRGDIPPGGSGVQPTGPGLGGLGTRYIGGSTWNPPPPRAPGAPPTGPGGFGGGMQWTENAGSGSGGPQRTGQAMPFSPYGVQQQISSEILRYGGRPNSGEGGSWSGGAQAAPMQSLFAPPPPLPSSAGGLRPPDVNAGMPSAPPSSPTSGSAYIDPNTRQGYVFINGRWQKADLSNRFPEGMNVTGPGFNRDDVGGKVINGYLPPGPVT